MKIKIKDLPPDFNLVGCKLGGRIITSGWNKGFWLKKKESDGEILPVFFKNFDAIKDWIVDVPPERALGLSQSRAPRGRKERANEGQDNSSRKTTDWRKVGGILPYKK